MIRIFSNDQTLDNVKLRLTGVLSDILSEMSYGGCIGLHKTNVGRLSSQI